MSNIHIIEIEDVIIAVTPIITTEGSRRDKERTAVAKLITRLLGADAQVRHRDDGAPYIAGGPHISITHCHDFAAIAICPSHPVGIDAEQWRPTLRRVAPKFLSPSEIETFTSDTALLRAWTIKEAVYKIAGAPAVDFRHNIAIAPDLSAATACGRPYRLHTFTHSSATVTLALPDNDIDNDVEKL